MKPTNSTEIRQAFLDFFEEMGHRVVPSSPLPVYDNPTLLFTNAGMNQFVDTFLGKENRSYRRAASSQKCMRVQGKHNDLENVGPSPRHHTFFEMLGNFSFGDYFKSGAIRFAFDFLTKVCEISERDLWYTVHIEDDDAFHIWVDEIGVPPQRVVRMGEKTNFWMMGDVGPCGPTSEVHYDWGAEHCTCDEINCGVQLDNDCGRWLEIWNLVFMQYNQDEQGNRAPLPKPGVDTGMGLERITAVVTQQPVNYDTDLFYSAMHRIRELLGDSEEERLLHETSYRVIADHGRAAAFLIADGVLPGNVGKSYVLRMIIRRAARFGRSIGFTSPFLSAIADVYIDQMGPIYPELITHRDHVLQTIIMEEKRFARTLDVALSQLDDLLVDLHQAHEGIVPGDVAFDLYATHGLPLEITRDVAGERGVLVDEDGFEAARAAHAEASGAGAFGHYDTEDSLYAELLNELVNHGWLDNTGIDYDPYSGARMESRIVGIIKDGQRIDRAICGDEVEIVTLATPFYIEAGGEVSDIGTIQVIEKDSVLRVTDAKMPVPGLIAHAGVVEAGRLVVGELVQLAVDNERRWDIRRNHTATHILHRELRALLGKHVTQQGSLVAPDRLRFDYSHGEAVDEETLDKIEAAINEAIVSNRQVSALHMAREDAISQGAMALFGEKYGDVVRTIQIGDDDGLYSFELCGGLHVRATGDIGLFRFTAEEAVGAGLRRVEAVTGRGALTFVRDRMATLNRISNRLSSPVLELETRIDALLAESRELRKELAQTRLQQAREHFSVLLETMDSIDGVSLMRGIVEGADMDNLRQMADWFRDRVDNGMAVLASIHDDRPILVVVVTEGLVPLGVDAGKLIRPIAGIVGGSGGGRPTMAQAGGKDVSKIQEALDLVPKLLEDAMTRPTGG
ncbi:MAG: alanine--tRNA ligase [Candidatus Promineifilaceae bacterium]